MKPSCRAERVHFSRAWLALAVCAVLAAGNALAAPYTYPLHYTTVYGTGTASGSVTFDSSLLVPNGGTGGIVCDVSLISAFTLNVSGLSTTPHSTTFTKSDLTGWDLDINSSGTITALNFFMGHGYCATSFNSDNYQISGVDPFLLDLWDVTGLRIAEFQLVPPSIPALSTYGVAALALLVLLAGALLVARRLS
ncbi:MAG: IPTL-CTERM sorting domain-containing protein [Acidobacteriia bacterium]|nr:IPTL-CTERM sorting domain-containing protein [Terriglobia bacterium]